MKESHLAKEQGVMKWFGVLIQFLFHDGEPGSNGHEGAGGPYPVAFYEGEPAGKCLQEEEEVFKWLPFWSV